MDDDRISYPDDLDSIELDAAFYYTVEIENEVVPDRAFIKDLFLNNAGVPQATVCSHNTLWVPGKTARRTSGLR